MITASPLPTSGDHGSTISVSVPTASKNVPWSKRKNNLTPTDEMLQLAVQQLNAIRRDDDLDVYGKYIVHKLRSLRGDQSYFLENSLMT